MDTLLRFFQETELVRNGVGVISLFVSDRYRSQNSTIQTVWSEALVMYCCVYIGRNMHQVLDRPLRSSSQKTTVSPASRITQHVDVPAPL